MLPYESFFYGGVFFLTGVAAAGIGFLPLAVTISTLFASAFFVFLKIKKHFWYAALLLFVIAGSVYYRIDDARFHEARIPYGQATAFAARVVSDPVRKGVTQTMIVNVETPFEARITLTLPAYPEVSYGDELSGRGTFVMPPDDGYGRYLEGKYVRGTLAFPQVTMMGVNRGNAVMTRLIAIKHFVANSFARGLRPEEATFLAGLTIGARGEFSKELTDAMQKSGTTHLVALSGYNISILAGVVMMLLVAFVSRRTAFVCATLAIGAFAVMTGAEASVVRAAIIGILVLLSFEIGRAHDMRNIILASALVMVLVSPKVLLFDVGFALSFLALLGIVYLAPALANIFGIELGKEGTLFPWRESLTMTLAAQLATLPILLWSFGMISPVSLFSNILILELVPMTMAFGFMTAFVSLFSGYAALVFGLFASILLKTELFLIYFFARIATPVRFSMGAILIIGYYALLGYIVWRYKKPRS